MAVGLFPKLVMGESVSITWLGLAVVDIVTMTQRVLCLTRSHIDMLILFWPQPSPPSFIIHVHPRCSMSTLYPIYPMLELFR